jgi:hypothetical protein
MKLAMAAAVGYLLFLSCGPVTTTGNYDLIKTPQSLGQPFGLTMAQHTIPRGFHGKLVPFAKTFSLRGGIDDESHDSEEGLGGDDDEEQDFEDIAGMKTPTRQERELEKQLQESLQDPVSRETLKNMTINSFRTVSWLPHHDTCAQFLPMQK